MKIPTIQDVIDKARKYRDQGFSQERAIQKAIASFPLPDSNQSARVLQPCHA
ncbi:hypothetical protein [Spirosoma koreense]